MKMSSYSRVIFVESRFDKKAIDDLQMKAIKENEKRSAHVALWGPFERDVLKMAEKAKTLGEDASRPLPKSAVDVIPDVKRTDYRYLNSLNYSCLPGGCDFDGDLWEGSLCVHCAHSLSGKKLK